MADEHVVHIGENSPEQVAYKLMRMIGSVEKKALDSNTTTGNRDWIIRTYCMCLRAVQQPGYPDAALETGKPKDGQ